MDALLEWAAEIGVSDSSLPITTASGPSACLGHSLVVSHFPDAGGRGLAAARDIRRGEMVLRVPRAALLTRENAFLRDPWLASCVGRHPHLSATQILIICLLAEVQKARASWWYPYLIQLPQSYNTLATFTKFESRAFQVDDATWASERTASKVNMDWKQAAEVMQEIKLRPQFVSFGAWLWASATVSSRALHIPWDFAGCLCPVGDLFNYAAPSGEERGAEPSYIDVQNGNSMLDLNFCSTETEYRDSSLRLTDGGYEDSLSSYCFYARQDYKKGEQVLLGYGTYTNLELLEHYGFLLSINPNDKIFIALEGSIKASDWPEDSLYIQQNGRPSFSLISALRLSLTPKMLRKAVGHMVYSGNQLSIDNEISAMRFLARSCLSTLQNLPTSVENDHALLDAIDRCLNDSSLEELNSVKLCSSEIDIFLQANNILNGENIVATSFPLKVRRSLERWKLAVKWRVTYKTSIINCISHCNTIVDGLSDNIL